MDQIETQLRTRLVLVNAALAATEALQAHYEGLGPVRSAAKVAQVNGNGNGNGHRSEFYFLDELEVGGTHNVFPREGIDADLKAVAKRCNNGFYGFYGKFGGMKASPKHFGLSTNHEANCIIVERTL